MTTKCVNQLEEQGDVEFQREFQQSFSQMIQKHSAVDQDVALGIKTVTEEIELKALAASEAKSVSGDVVGTTEALEEAKHRLGTILSLLGSLSLSLSLSLSRLHSNFILHSSLLATLLSSR